jgi:hypothetical protein
MGIVSLLQSLKDVNDLLLFLSSNKRGEAFKRFKVCAHV